LIVTVAFRTLGCRLNQAETDAFKSELTKFNLREVSGSEPANLTVINSCAVTRAAEAKTRATITAARRISPNGKIAIVGCYSQLAAAELLDIPGVYLVLGNNEKYNLFDFLEEIDQGEKIVRVTTPGLAATTFRAGYHSALDLRIRVNLKIQEGCDYYCAYCILPYLRGAPRSREPQDCIAEIRQLTEQGVREIILTGINLGRYQSSEGDLAALIRRLLDETTIPRIRLSSIEPDLITPQLIELIASEPRLCRYLHIPLQHGADTVLGLMKRHYQTADYAALVNSIKQRMPEICIGADVMVGFPGETESEFEQMRRFIENIDITYLHVFRYSARPGTPAADLGDHIPDSEKKRRSAILRQLSGRKRTQFMQTFSGKVCPVLFEEKIATDTWQGLTDNYVKVRANSKEHLYNRIRKVRIIHVSGDFLKGELLSE